MDGGFLFAGKGLEVARIDPKDARSLILERHYLHRVPQVLFAFGLFRDGELVGVCTFGRPASHTVCKSVCGPENAHLVYELNRLALRDNLPNEASFLVGRALRMLPGGLVVVSYADSSQGHVGYVYQAANWLYAGMSDSHVDKSSGGKHGRHSWNAEVAGKPRPRKHRYVAFTGTKSQKRNLRKALRWKTGPYPKTPASDRLDGHESFDS